MQWEGFVSGMIAGSSGVFVGFPLETLRVRLQTQKGHTEFRGAMDCFIKTIRGEGVRGLYKGLSAPLIGASLTKTINFGVFGVAQKYQHVKGKEVSLLSTTISGVASSLVACFVLTPVDRTKILLQIQRSSAEMKLAKSSQSIVKLGLNLHKHEKRTFSGPIQVVQKLGFRAMYQGHSATMMREGIYGAAYFSSFEYYKRLFSGFGASAGSYKSKRGTTEDIPMIYSFLSGGAAGATMWTLIFPVDVVKSKMQQSQKPVGSMLSVAKAHYAKEGALAFYKGWRPAVVRSFPVHGTILMMYSFILDILLDQDDE